jgi:hypothetical protein
MQADDRILVAYVPNPGDFALIQAQQWYRIPADRAPKGVHAEWIAFYFGRSFGPLRHAIHWIAPTRGHELVRRRDLLPDQPDHPRADQVYYKVQLGEPERLDRPIISLRWRRVLFIHTTGDRFMQATEINDLLLEGPQFSDRRQITLRDQSELPYGDAAPSMPE